MPYYWPNNLPLPGTDFSEKYERPLIKSEKDAGYEQTRPRHTRTRRTFEFTLKITLEEKDSITDFFENSTAFGGESFYWTHPIDNEDIDVRLDQDSVDFQRISAFLRSVKIKLKEV